MKLTTRIMFALSIASISAFMLLPRDTMAKPVEITDTSSLPKFVKDEIPNDASKIIKFDSEANKYSFIAIFRKTGKGRVTSKLIAYLNAAPPAIPSMLWTNKWVSVEDYQFEEIEDWIFGIHPVLLIKQKTGQSSMEVLVTGLKSANLVVLASLKGKSIKYVPPIDGAPDDSGTLELEVAKRNSGKGEKIVYKWNGIKLQEVDK